MSSKIHTLSLSSDLAGSRSFECQFPRVEGICECQNIFAHRELALEVVYTIEFTYQSDRF